MPGIAPSSIFLETSILICKTVKQPFLSQTTQHFIESKNAFTGASEYSILEYHNSVIECIDNVVSKLKTEKDFANARERITNVSRASWSKRKPQMYDTILNHTDLILRKKFDAKWRSELDDFYQKERALMGAKYLTEFKANWIKNVKSHADSWTHTNRQLTNNSNGIGCHLVKLLEQNATIKKECSPNQVRCNVVRFLKLRIQKLRKIRSAIFRLPKDEQTNELMAFCKTIKTFIENPNSAADYKQGCVRLADVLIALDASNFSSIYSQNPKEFKVLCQALKKHFYEQPHDGKLQPIHHPAPTR